MKVSSRGGVLLFSRIPFILFLFTAAALPQDLGPLGGIATLRDAVSKRISSYDRSGGYDDFTVIKAGQTLALADITAAGSIKHVWMTIDSPSQDHLRELVLRMYWDGENEPSVESPIGDFFGAGFAQYKSWQSLPLTVKDKALNCYFPMPFGRSARITVTNEGGQDVPHFFYQVDYEQYRSPAAIAGMGRFHAHWRRENPTRGVPVEVSKRINLTGKDNYLFVEAEGRGQFVGVILYVQSFATGWWGEGDDMFFVDGESFPPSLHGTGLEDYFGNAWGFPDEHNYPFTGYSLRTAARGGAGGLNTAYRFHLVDPVYFTKSLVAGIEHGHANSRSDDYASVAYWYQTEPHKKFDPLPNAAERAPNRYWKVQPLKSNVPD